MEQGDTLQPRRLPFRRRLQRVVYLHVALAVAVSRSALLLVLGGDASRQQAPVKLRRRDRADYSASGPDRLAGREPHAVSVAGRDEHFGHVAVLADFAALLGDQRLEGFYGPGCAALHNRCAGGLERESDHPRDLAG